MAINKKGYTNKNYSNPYFNNKQEDTSLDKISLKKKILACFVFLLLIFIGWLLIFSNLFLIKNIKIIGSNRVSEQEIINIVTPLFDGGRFCPVKNIFCFNSELAKEKILEKYYFKNLLVKKSISRNLEIIIEEKPYFAVWIEDGQIYLIDEVGNITANGTASDLGSSTMVIENIGKEKIKNNLARNKDFLEYGDNLFRKTKTMPEIKAKKYFIDDEKNTIKIETEQGVSIFFSVNENIDKQVEKLLTLIRERPGENFFKKKYIDLRFGDRIYFQ